jgi:hypothetical protein
VSWHSLIHNSLSKTNGDRLSILDTGWLIITRQVRLGKRFIPTILGNPEKNISRCIIHREYDSMTKLQDFDIWQFLIYSWYFYIPFRKKARSLWNSGKIFLKIRLTQTFVSVFLSGSQSPWSLQWLNWIIFSVYNALIVFKC